MRPLQPPLSKTANAAKFYTYIGLCTRQIEDSRTRLIVNPDGRRCLL